MNAQADGLSQVPVRSSYLPWTQEPICAGLVKFHMFTASQLRRLNYQGTNKGTKNRASYHLKRLTELGYVRRFKGVYAGAAEYIYTPPSSKARRPDMHMLDVNELYVRLEEAHPAELTFHPEPMCHVSVGHMLLKPDAYIDLGHMRYFIEMDEFTELSLAILSAKMRRYVTAYEHWPDSTFPLCVWVCHEPDRRRFIMEAIRRQSIPELFECVLFDEATSRLLKG